MQRLLSGQEPKQSSGGCAAAAALLDVGDSEEHLLVGGRVHGDVDVGELAELPLSIPCLRGATMAGVSREMAGVP